MLSTRDTLVAIGSPALAVLALALPSAPVRAQLQPQAIYPLLTDLLDTTNTYGPLMLLGNPTPPAPPANGVCVNGVYALSTGGQDARTPIISTVNANDFQIDVEFNIAALPTTMSPVLMAGRLYRWIGIYVQASGLIGLKYNNSNFSWTTTTVTTNKWYIASIKFDSGTVELILDGVMVHTASLGALNTGGNLDFTTNDFSNGRNHNGCIRNLAIWNDATLGNVASATTYGSGCGGIVLRANGRPVLGNVTFSMAVSNLGAPPLAYLALGRAAVNPGIDLTAIGMAGCFSYTSFDVLMGPFVGMSGTATVPLPIPNIPALLNVVLYAQGIGYSTATSLGLATSNGTQLVLGL